ncbi:MAG: tyrosine-type recombinase/integrase [Tissierellales bacterium]|jgi:integrase/recombinase XerC|nr:tyrosine-type recombinase/integrase [Tissierellales bacterium]
MFPNLLDELIHDFKWDLTNKKKLNQSAIRDSNFEIIAFFNFIYTTSSKKSFKNLKENDIERYIEFCIQKGVQKKTINEKIRTIRKFYNYLIDDRQILSYNPTSCIYYFKIEAPSSPKFISRKEVEKVIRVLSERAKSPINSNINDEGIRDIAISQMMAYLGLKLKDILNLRVDDVSLINKKIRLNYKGENRFVNISSNLMMSLLKYESMSYYFPDESNYYFKSYSGHKYCARTFQRHFKEAVLISGLNKTLTPSSLKNSYAYYMALENSEDELKKILNQDKVTQYYDNNPNLESEE